MLVSVQNLKNDTSRKCIPVSSHRSFLNRIEPYDALDAFVVAVVFLRNDIYDNMLVGVCYFLLLDFL